MRIDSHVHLWHYNLADYGWIDDSQAQIQRDFLPQDLFEALDSGSMDAAIVVQARQCIAENEFLLACSDTDRIAGVVGWVDLQSPSVAEDLARLTENKKLVGVRHIVQAEPDPEFLARPAFRCGIERLEGFNLTYDLLIYSHQLPQGIGFCKAFPSLRIVLDHCAKPGIRRGDWEPWAGKIAELARLENVFCKISGLSFEADWEHWTAETLRPYVEHVLGCFGPDRVLFGSDWPVSLTPGSYARTVSCLESCFSCLNADELLGVMGRNAMRLYGIC